MTQQSNTAERTQADTTTQEQEAIERGVRVPVQIGMRVNALHPQGDYEDGEVLAVSPFAVLVQPDKGEPFVAPYTRLDIHGCPPPMDVPPQADPRIGRLVEESGEGAGICIAATEQQCIYREASGAEIPANWSQLTVADWLPHMRQAQPQPSDDASGCARLRPGHRVIFLEDLATEGTVLVVVENYALIREDKGVIAPASLDQIAILPEGHDATD